MKIDIHQFLDSLGGLGAAMTMSDEVRADALESYLEAELARAVASSRPTKAGYPSMADLESEIETRTFRRGVGKLFVADAHVKRLPPMPKAPTLLDFFNLRFQPADHLLQSATLALKNGAPEEVILACLLHDTGQSLMRTEHGWWGAQLYWPYVSPRTAFAIRYHQVLRFFPDADTGYSYPELYYEVFGVDYTPPAHVERTYQYVRKHKWYIDARLVTVNDLYAFDSNAAVSIEPFVDIIGRHFRQPAEGLGYDNAPIAHMWRAIAAPDTPL